MKKLIGLVFLLAIVSGCRTAADHYKLFEKKGGKIEPVEKQVTVSVMVPGKDGKDSLIYIQTTTDCPEIEAPKTNSQTRQENKTERAKFKMLERQFEDSLRAMEKMHKQEMKLAVKQTKLQSKKDKQTAKTERTVSRQENKRNWWLLWLVLGFVSGIVSYHWFRKLIH